MRMVETTHGSIPIGDDGLPVLLDAAGIDSPEHDPSRLGLLFLMPVELVEITAGIEQIAEALGVDDEEVDAAITELKERVTDAEVRMPVGGSELVMN